MKRKRLFKGARFIFCGIFVMAFLGATLSSLADDNAPPMNKWRIGQRLDWSKSPEGYMAAVGRGKKTSLDTARPLDRGRPDSKAKLCVIEAAFEEPQIVDAELGQRIIMYKTQDKEPLPYADGIPGTPRLPICPLKALLPAGHDAVAIEVIPGELVKMPGTYKIEPVQQAWPITDEPQEIKPTEPDPEVYGSDKTFPQEPADGMVQWKGGYGIFFTTYCPVEYVPVSGELSWRKSVRIVIKTEPFPEEDARETKMGKFGPIPKHFKPDPRLRKDMSKFVDNPDELKSYVE